MTTPAKLTKAQARYLDAISDMQWHEPVFNRGRLHDMIRSLAALGLVEYEYLFAVGDVFKVRRLSPPKRA